jgi:hypothetical protein
VLDFLWAGEHFPLITLLVGQLHHPQISKNNWILKPSQCFDIYPSDSPTTAPGVILFSFLD